MSGRSGKLTHLDLTPLHDLKIVERVTMLKLAIDDVAEDFELRVPMCPETRPSFYAVLIDDTKGAKVLESLRRVVVRGKWEMVVCFELRDQVLARVKHVSRRG